MWQEIEETMNDLEKSLAQFKKSSKEYAQAERDYRVALAKELTILRAKGLPVTHLKDIAFTNEKIADLKYKRDLAEGIKNASYEGINFYKIKVRELEAQYNREYGNPNFRRVK